MVRMVRKLLVLAFVGACVAALIRWRRLDEGGHPSFASASWPPIEPAAEPSARPLLAAQPARWVPPVDGVAPEGYPIKANDDSMIFHVPGGRFYARTRAERCYADAADAIADGYRAAKA